MWSRSVHRQGAIISLLPREGSGVLENIFDVSSLFEIRSDCELGQSGSDADASYIEGPSGWRRSNNVEEPLHAYLARFSRKEKCSHRSLPDGGNPVGYDGKQSWRRSADGKFRTRQQVHASATVPSGDCDGFYTYQSQFIADVLDPQNRVEM